MSTENTSLRKLHERAGTLWAALAAFALVSMPGAAEACAVCFQAKSDASRVAFIASTAAMTVLPLVLILGVAWWVRNRFREAEAEAAVEPISVGSLRPDPFARRAGLAGSR